MRRAALFVTFTTVTICSGACASLPFYSAERSMMPPQDSAPSGPVATSQKFDHPFPVAGDAWDATITLSNLRFVQSNASAEAVLAVDVRAVQASGQPELGPDDLSAYSPSGAQFDRIQNPAGLVADPLVPSVMTSAGEEIQGMVAWTMPPGDRIGRIEVASPRTLASITITRQPVDPSAQPTGSAPS